MNRKGFGLIQFLGYIALFGIILCVGLYSARDTLSRSLSVLEGASKSEIYDASEDYVSENKVTWINNGTEEYTCLTVMALVDAGYFKKSEVTTYKEDMIRVDREPKIKIVSSIQLVSICE